MRSQDLLAIGAAALLVASCGQADQTAAALATFERFQDALFAVDAAAVRSLVTDESRPVVDAMPWARIAQQHRLVAVEASDQRGCFHVVVRAADAEQAMGTYVVIRENGALVVDLVATAALCAVPSGATGEPPVLQPRPLTPADFDAVRRRALATPPGSPVR